MFVWAELDGLICSGATKGGKPTYALLEERVQKIKTYSKEEALATLAKKYFNSRGPATIQDFAWWSGLPIRAANQALELVSSDFIAESTHSQTYWLPNSLAIPNDDQEMAYLLPAFDEFIISYKNRSASLSFSDHNKAVSSNGIFRPVIVVNGQVWGIWKRFIKKDEVFIEVQLFRQPDKHTKSLIEAASIRYGQFLNKKPVIIFKT